MATIKDIATRCNVSVATVSYAINGLTKNISPTTKEKILRVCEELDYHPNGAARNLKRKKTYNIGVFIYDFAGPTFSSILAGINKKLNDAGYTIIVSTGNRSKQILLEKQVDAAIIFDNKIEDETIIFFAKHSPVVLLDRELQGKNIFSSLLNNKEPVYSLIKLLIEKGYHEFGYLSGPSDSYNNNQRFSGFKKALEEYKLNYTVYQGDFTIQSGYDNGLHILSKLHPRFIYCANDELAVGLIKAAQELNIKIPEELGIAGYDNINLCEYVTPKLTTIDVSYYRWGESVSNFLVSFLEDNKDISLSPTITKIIWRKSC
ncbi:MAG: LacI family transcriptional regulator [Acholeplasmatales bacterium]|jgi:LacI family transcriptional regulator|nr:LacI family transcriptional regulator [Acholeplasmatales bacterium]